jgi:hypothetical protein
MDRILAQVPADASGLIPGKGLRPILTRAEIPVPALKQVRARGACLTVCPTRSRRGVRVRGAGVDSGRHQQPRRTVT